MTARPRTVPTWLRGTMLLIGTLIVGVAIGILATRMSPSGQPHAMDTEALMRTLTRDLALDSAQRRAIVRVFDRHQAAIDSAWRKVQPSVRAAIDSSQMEIVQVLNADQRAKFLTLLRRAHPGMSGPIP